MTTWLLDASVLIALTQSGHTGHDACAQWFRASTEPFATCPITQLAVVRFALRERQEFGVTAGLRMLGALTTHPRHVFWPDGPAADSVGWSGVVGHRQVTDAYLAGLARSHGGKLLTLDAGLVALHADVAARP